MRYTEIDFTKGVLIILMVMFHLNYYGTFMPQVVDPFVYSFHVSSFMLISGFLFKPDKDRKGFWKSYRYLMALYLLFNLTDYILVATYGKILGSSSQLELSVVGLLNVIFVAPAGTYWYIHSLLWLFLVYWLIFKLPISGGGKIILLFVTLWVININDKLPWNMYFAVGAAYRQISNNYKNRIAIFSPTWIAFIPLVLITIFTQNFVSNNLIGLATSMCFISFMMWTASHCGHITNRFVSYIGKNTLCILLFSPFLTIMSKLWHGVFAFDNFEIIYALFSVTIVISICLLSAFVWDKIRLSKIFGRNLYVKY